MKKFILLSLIGMLGLSTMSFASRIIQVKGSDTIVNASQYIVEEYMVNHSNARIAVTGGGSGVGISSLINGTADIGMASRNIKEKEIQEAKKRGEKLNEVVIGFEDRKSVV